MQLQEVDCPSRTSLMVSPLFLWRKGPRFKFCKSNPQIYCLSKTNMNHKNLVAICSAIAILEVKPGDSIPKRLTRPAIP